MNRFTTLAAVGVALAAAACSSDTTMPADHEAAMLVAVSPANGSAGVVVGSTVAVTFSGAMQSAQPLAALHKGEVTGALVAGTWSWSTDQTKLTFTPAQPLEPATRYTIHVGGGLKDAEGMLVNLDRHGQHMGGLWATGMMHGDATGGSSHMGAAWQCANGSYGILFTFTTAAAAAGS